MKLLTALVCSTLLFAQTKKVGKRHLQLPPEVLTDLSKPSEVEVQWKLLKGTPLENCPYEGDTKNPDIWVINYLKNRTRTPEERHIDRSITLEKLLTPGDDREHYDPMKAVVIEGYITKIQVGGVETHNCFNKDPQWRDTHIDIGLTPNSPNTECIVAEVTPRWRDLMHKKLALDWSTRTLKKLYLGQKVRITGWLFCDLEHMSSSENMYPGREGNWRASIWEIHPVTSIEFIK